MHTTHVLTTGLHTQIAEGLSEISNILLNEINAYRFPLLERETFTSQATY